MTSADTMKSSNQQKAITGNKFQNNFFEKTYLLVHDVAQIKNNVSYNIMIRDIVKDTKSDVEIILHCNRKIRFIFELTTSIRDDRYLAKDAQAEGISKILETKGQQCFYCLVMPDDDYYSGENAEKERNNNAAFAEKINQRLITNTNHHFLHIMFREGEALAFIDSLKDLTDFDVLNLVQEWRQKIKDNSINKITCDLPEMEQLSFF